MTASVQLSTGEQSDSAENSCLPWAALVWALGLAVVAAVTGARAQICQLPELFISLCPCKCWWDLTPKWISVCIRTCSGFLGVTRLGGFRGLMLVCFTDIMTTGASSDITQPDYLWVSVMCEMKGVFNLQGWVFMEPDQIGIWVVISVHAISVFSVRHETGGTGDSHSCLFSGDTA